MSKSECRKNVEAQMTKGALAGCLSSSELRHLGFFRHWDFDIRHSICHQWLQLELAEQDLKPLVLQQDLAGRGNAIETLIHFLAVDLDRDPIALAEALDAGPLAQR